MSEKSSQPSEEIRGLKARLAAVEEQLAAVEAQNGQLLRERRELAERLAKGKELVSALVATVPELAFRSDGGSSGSGGSSSTHATTASSSGAPQQEPVALPAPPHEPTTVTAAIPAAAPQELAAEAAGWCKTATATAAIPAAPAQETLPVGLLFVGGSFQYVGILSSVKDIPAVRDMLEKAGAILGFDVLKLCLEGPADELAPAGDVVTYIAALAGLEKLRLEREETVRRARVMTGLGVGQYAALVAAGVLPFEDGLKSVRLRWDSIMEATMASRQATAIVRGLQKHELAALCAEATKRGGSGATCQISAEYSALSFTVGGTEKSVLALRDLAAKAGALQAHVVPASSAHNTPLLELARERVSSFLDELLPKMKPPRTSVFLNPTAAPVRPGTDPKDVVAVLKKELTSTVLWAPSVEAMIREGVSEFYEVGPGEMLRGHMRHINAKLWRTMTNVQV